MAEYETRHGARYSRCTEAGDARGSRCAEAGDARGSRCTEVGDARVNKWEDCGDTGVSVSQLEKMSQWEREVEILDDYTSSIISDAQAHCKSQKCTCSQRWK